MRTDPRDSLGWLDRGGEMGRLIKGADWSDTPLGQMDTWPRALTWAIRLILESRYPMFIWWGPELTNIYNDAYAPFLGARHPGALGRPAQRIWDEIWPIVGPQAEIVLREGRATWNESVLLMMERFGYPEETYFTFGYSSLPDDDGETGGVLGVCTEETARVISERRLALLRDLASNTGQARSWHEAAQAAAGTFMTRSQDLPFALIYEQEPDGAGFSLAAAAGIAPDHPGAPARVPLTDGRPWPLVAAGHAPGIVVIDGLGDAIGVPLPSGAWEHPPLRAALVPIAPSGQTGRPGVLVVGLNPHRPFDDAYANFLHLIAGQLSASIASAHAREEERKRADALAELDRAKTAFFSNISHEFRTPLTLMLGPVEDLLAGARGPLEPGVRDELEVVRRNSLRLLRLVNTLLEFSRIEAGRVQANYVRTDLPRFTAELAGTFRSAIERAGLRLVVEASPLPEGVEAWIDREMWERIVYNLLSNSLKFTFEGRILISLTAEAGQLVLSVSDTGTGIPEAELPRLFERFHRVEGGRARSHEGSGIGLALVSELVRLHGGSVSVESEVGRGTTVRVAIPAGAGHLPPDRLDADSPPTDEVSTPFVSEASGWISSNGALDDDALDLDAALGAMDVPGDRAGSHGATQRPRVLVADDNRDLRAYLTRLLAYRYEVIAVGDGQAALDAVRDLRPDLVLADVMMPELDGFALLRALREGASTREIPVVLLSARAAEEARVEGIEAGADDYLVKPFAARELLARVDSHLELARLRRDVAERERAARATAERSRARLAAIFEQAAAGMAETDQDGRFIMVNDRYCAIAGRPREELMRLRLQDIVHPDDVARHVEIFATMLRDGGDLRAERRYVRPDGASVWVHDSVARIDDADGATHSVLTVSEDITERMRADEVRDTFLGILSHELRTPVTTILASAELLARPRVRDEAATRELVADLGAEASRLERLVEDLLVLTRTERGELRLHSEPVLVLHAVRAAVEVESKRFPGVDFVIDVPSGLPPAAADRTYLEQVLRNLLSNAAKYGWEQGSEVRVTAGREGERIAIRVLDDGPGFSVEDGSELFDLFFRDPSNRSMRPGAGIGLYVTRALIEAMGGDVWAKLREPRGAEFGVRLAFMD